MEFDQNKIYKIGVYWRKSRWNGFRTIPVVMELNGQTLILRTRKQEVFNVSITSISITYHIWTITLVVNGKSYNFLTGSNNSSGSRVSRGFSASQVAEIANQKIILPLPENIPLPNLDQGGFTDINGWYIILATLRSPYSLPGAQKKANLIALAFVAVIIIIVLGIRLITVNH